MESWQSFVRLRWPVSTSASAGAAMSASPRCELGLFSTAADAFAIRKVPETVGRSRRLLLDEAFRQRLRQCGDGELPLCHNGAFAPTGSIQYENSFACEPRYSLPHLNEAQIDQCRQIIL